MTGSQHLHRVIAYLILVVTAVVSQSDTPVLAQPRLHVKEGILFDLGDVSEGITIRRKLSVTNEGNDSLILNDVTTSCGCTIVKVGDRRIGPGTSTTLLLSINTKEMRGPVRKEIYLDSNDPQTTRTTITYRMTIRNEIEFQPSYVNFGAVQKNTSSTRMVTFRNRTGSSFKLLGVSANDSQIKLTALSHVLAPRDSVEVRVTLRPRMNGKIVGQFEVETNSKRNPKILISYIAMSQ